MVQLIITEILVTSAAVPTSLAVQRLEKMEAAAANI